MRAVEAAFGCGERPEQELAERLRRVEPVVALEPPPRLRECREREAVPGRDHLVVEARLRPRRALGEQPCLRLSGKLAAQDRAAVLERLQELGGDTFFLRPRERQTFDAVRVRV